MHEAISNHNTYTCTSIIDKVSLSLFVFLISLWLVLLNHHPLHKHAKKKTKKRNLRTIEFHALVHDHNHLYPLCQFCCHYIAKKQNLRTIEFHQLLLILGCYQQCNYDTCHYECEGLNYGCEQVVVGSIFIRGIQKNH